MDEINSGNSRGPPSLTPEQIQKLEKLKGELAAIQAVMGNMQGRDKYEIEGRVRQFQDKEAEIKRFLHELGLAT